MLTGSKLQQRQLHDLIAICHIILQTLSNDDSQMNVLLVEAGAAPLEAAELSAPAAAAQASPEAASAGKEPQRASSAAIREKVEAEIDAKAQAIAEEQVASEVVSTQLQCQLMIV